MRRSLVMALAMLPAVSAAQATGTYAVVSEYTVINDGAGTQTDPHVSGNLVAYTDESFSPPQVHVQTLGGGESIIPDGWFSDIWGSHVVFSRVSAPQCSSILVYDVSTQETAELNPADLYDVSTGQTAPADPANGCWMRDHAAIGGSTVAWVDSGIAGTSESEIVVFDLETGQGTRLTHDNVNDFQPAVAPDGETVVWTSCLDASHCEIHSATRGADGMWSVTTPTTPTSGEHPATDGTILVYQAVGSADLDLWYRPLGGGDVIQVPLTDGVQQNASVAGGLIAFESRPNGLNENFDIYLYDTTTERRYQLTYTPYDERLSDIDVDPTTGEVTVVYVATVDGDQNIYALRFKLEAPSSPNPCDSTSGRDVLATLTLTRQKDAVNSDSVTFPSTGGTGLLCVQNGSATTGKVIFNGKARFGSSDLKKSVVWLEASVDLLNGENVLSAAIGGQPGTTYTVTVYGPLTAGSAVGGCSSASGGASLLALLALVVLVVRGGRLERARARRSNVGRR
jgi:hypothetical protein